MFGGFIFFECAPKPAFEPLNPAERWIADGRCFLGSNPMFGLGNGSSSLVKQWMLTGRKERDAALHEGSRPCHLSPQGYLMLLKLSKHRHGTFPNLKRQQHLIINASFNRAANEARDCIRVVGVSSGMANHAPALRAETATAGCNSRPGSRCWDPKLAHRSRRMG